MIIALFRTVAVACVVAALGAAANADPTPVPSPAPLPTLPPPPNPLIRTGVDLVIRALADQQRRAANGASGTVTFFKRFDLQIETSPNRYRTIHLHQGTVIDPRGVSLSPGETVDVAGQGEPDGSLDAATITIRR